MGKDKLSVSWWTRATTSSSMCSGAFTAEMALAVASAVVNDMADLCPPGTIKSGRSFEENRRAIFQAPQAERQWCVSHGHLCPVPRVDIDISGLPCTDNSQSNTRRMFQEGPTGPLFAIWARRLLTSQIPLAVLENTPDLRVEVLEGMLKEHYMIFPVHVDMADVGHSGVSRKRVYVIFASKASCRMLVHPVRLYDFVSAQLRATYRTKPSDYLTADSMEVQWEASEVARKRCLPFRSNIPNLDYLLSSREKDAVHKLGLEYHRRFNRDPCKDVDLVYFLGDDPAHTLNWSAVSRKIPTFRKNAGTGKFWFPAFGRWLTSTEKLAVLSFPVRSPMASTLDIPCLEAKDPKRAAQLVGNSMSLLSAALIEMVALSCATRCDSSRGDGANGVRGTVPWGDACARELGASSVSGWEYDAINAARITFCGCCLLLPEFPGSIVQNGDFANLSYLDGLDAAKLKSMAFWYWGKTGATRLSPEEKEDAVKLAPVLAQEYQRRGRPGDHLSGELIHSITQCVFQGQDSYRLTYVADNQRWILDNSMIEHDITAHLDAPYRKSYVLRVCKGSGRTYVVASDSVNRVSPNVLFCDTVLAPSPNLLQTPTEIMAKEQIRAMLSPAALSFHLLGGKAAPSDIDPSAAHPQTAHPNTQPVAAGPRGLVANPAATTAAPPPAAPATEAPIPPPLLATCSAGTALLPGMKGSPEGAHVPLIGQKAGVPVPKTAGPGELAVLPAPEHPAAAPEQTQNAGLPTPNIPDAASPSAPKAAMADAGKGSTRPVAAPVCDAPSSSEEEQQELVLPPYRIHCSADGVSSIEDTVTHEEPPAAPVQPAAAPMPNPDPAPPAVPPTLTEQPVNPKEPPAVPPTLTTDPETPKATGLKPSADASQPPAAAPASDPAQVLVHGVDFTEWDVRPSATLLT
ncbi:ttn-1, partial [Symbiodinium sp. KB8]